MSVKLGRRIGSGESTLEHSVGTPVKNKGSASIDAPNTSKLSRSIKTQRRKTLPDHGEAEVEKFRVKEERPSTHSMRTRARGPAEIRKDI